MLNVSIVIPVYNSGNFIEPSIRRLIQFCGQQPWTYEILLRDDGSADDSLETIRRLAEEYPQLTYSANHANLGLGVTLRRLFQQAQGATVVYCDIDLPFGVEVLPEVISLNKTHDLVVVSRYLSRRGAGVPWLRKLASRLYYGFCRILFHVPICDIGSGTVAISQRALDKISLQARGFDIHIELIMQIQRQGCPFREIPGRYLDKGGGTFSILRHGPGVLLSTVKLWFRREEKS